MKRRLLSSSVLRAVETLWAAVIMLVVTPLLINALGTDSYGLWLLLLSGIGLLNFFELGFAIAIQRRMAQAIEHKNIVRLNQLFSSAMCLFALLSLLALTGLLLLILFPGWLGITQSHQHLATIALSFLALKVVVDYLANAIHGIFSGQLRFDLDSKISILAITTKAVLMVLLVDQYGVLGLVVITLLTDFTAHLAKFIFAYKIQPGLQLSWPVSFRQDCVDLFVYARHVIVLELAKLVQDKSIIVLISQLLGLVAISIYAIADRLLRQATMLVQTITTVLQPYLVRKIEQGQLSVHLLQKCMQLHAWLTAVVLLPVMLCGPAFIVLWVGPEFTLSQPLLLILILSALLRVLTLPVSLFLLAKSLHQWLAPLELLAAASYIGLVLWLGRKFGLQGIAWSGVVIAFGVHTLCYAFVAYRIMHVRFLFSLFLVGRLVLMFVLIFGLNYQFQIFSVEMTWFSLPLLVLTSLVVAAVVGYYLLLDSNMRTIFWQTLRARRKSFGINSDNCDSQNHNPKHK